MSMSILHLMKVYPASAFHVIGPSVIYIKVYPASNPGWNGWMGQMGPLGQMGWMGWHALFYVPIYTPKCPLMSTFPLVTGKSSGGDHP